MRKIIVILVLSAVVCLLYFFYKTVIKNSAENSSKIESIIENNIGTDSTGSTGATAGTNETSNTVTFTTKKDDTKIEELFIDGSAQHNYVDITGTEEEQKAVSQALHRKDNKEDRHDYLSGEQDKKDLKKFEKQFKTKRMNKDQLFSALMDAVYYNQIPKALALIKKGAPVNSQVKNSEFTPLFMAISNGNAKMVTMLLDNDASLDIYDSKGLTPIHRAITEANYTGKTLYPTNDIIEALLEYGADINIPTRKEQYTPLIMTALEHKANTMEYLLKSGANEELKDKKGITALEYAKQYKCTACLRLLIK